MIWLSEKQILFLHGKLIEATGGSADLRDESLLQSALLAPLQTYDSVELFPSIVDKAARLACGLTLNHPFVDGNKRIGVHAALVTLKLNGIAPSYTQKELSDEFLALASDNLSFEELRDWINSHVK